MVNKVKTEVTLNFKTSFAKNDEYQHFWRQNNFSGLSELAREAIDQFIEKTSQGAPHINSRIMSEFNIHLGRVNGQMMEIMTKAANSNTPPEGSEMEQAVQQTLRLVTKIHKTLKAWEASK